jgi:hypothetical protein
LAFLLHRNESNLRWGATLVFSILLSIMSFELCAQEGNVSKSFFKKRDFGEYFYADKYAPISSIGIGHMKLLNNYDVGRTRSGTVIAAEPTLGAQIPIYYYKDEFRRWSLSMPLSFAVWFDFTEKRTSPILNTDYRIALLEFNYSLILKNSWFNNVGFRFVPFFHESTHIGDELIISNLRDSIPLKRINVSYETIELSAVFNDRYHQKIKNHSIRFGAKILWNRKKGYYTVDSLEVSNPLVITPSKRWIEPYLQYQFQNPDAWLSNEKMMFVFSQDLYLRVRYGYGIYYKSEFNELDYREPGEAYQLCSTSMIGWKFYNSKKEVSNSGIFFKLYLGINPHGQFRNVPSYPWVGFHWVYDI